MRWTAWSPGLALVLAGVGAAGAEGLTLEAVAVDYSSALAAQHGESGHEPPPLAGVEVGLRVESAVGQPPRSIAARTDAGGRVRVELGEVPPGTRVRLEVRAGEGGVTGGAARSYLARPWVAGEGPPPAVLRFYRVAERPERIGLARVLRVVTVQDDEGPERRYVRVRQVIQVVNFGFEVWTGDPGTEPRASFHVPVPEGFEVRTAGANDAEVLAEPPARLPHGGLGIPYREPIFPGVPGEDRGTSFLAIFTRPYADGEVLELGFHLEHPLGDYSLNLEEPGLHYRPPAEGSGDLALEDGGVNPPMGTSRKSTRSWVATQVPPHTNLGGSVGVGAPPVHPRTALVLGLIALVVFGAAGLGMRLSRRAAARAAAGPPADGDAATGLLRALDAIADRPLEPEATARGEDLRTLARALRELYRGGPRP